MKARARLKEFGGGLFGDENARLGYEAATVGHFVGALAGGVEALEEFVGVGVQFVHGRLQAKDMGAVSGANAELDRLEDASMSMSMPSEYGMASHAVIAAMEEHDPGRTPEAVEAGVAEEVARLAEKPAGRDLVRVDLFDAGVGHARTMLTPASRQLVPRSHDPQTTPTPAHATSR